MDTGTVIFLVIFAIIIIGGIVIYLFFKDSFMSLFESTEEAVFGEAKTTVNLAPKKLVDDLCAPGGAAYEITKQNYGSLDEDDLVETCIKIRCGENLEKCK